VGVLVPLYIVCRIAQSEIRRKVNDAFGHSGELYNAFHRRAMWHRKEQHIAGLQFCWAHKTQVCPSTQVGVHKVSVLTGIGLGRDLRHFDFGVIQ